MRRPGTDPENVQMSDVLCDFCRTPWREDLPVIEGHQGSIICGGCLSAAYVAVVNRGEPTASGGGACTMCLEKRDEPAWKSPEHDAVICRRCVKLGAGALERDKDYGWKRPTA